MIRDDIGELLHGTGWPFHTDRLDPNRVSHAELRHQAVTIIFAIPAGDLAHLPAPRSGNGCLDPDLRPDGGAIGNGAHAFDPNPMVAVTVIMVEKIVLPGTFRHKQIEEAVIVVIAPNAANGIASVCHDVAAKNFAERPITVVAIKKVSLVGCIGYKEIQISVIVIVAPGAAHGAPAIGDDRAGDDPGEGAVMIVVIENVIASVRTDEQIQIPIIIVVAPGGAKRISNIGCDAACCHFGEGAVAVIMVEKVFLAIIGNKQIEKAIIIVITPRAAFGIAYVSCDCACGDSGESAVTIVVVKKIACATAIGDEQIKETVIIIIAPSASDRIGDVVHDAAGRHFCEAAGTRILIEEVFLTQVRNEEIKVAVVVVISPRGGERKAAVRDDTHSQDCGESAGAVVVVEKFVFDRGRAAIGRDQIKITIVVIIAPGPGKRSAMIGNNISRGDPGKRRVGRHFGRSISNRRSKKNNGGLKKQPRPQRLFGKVHGGD